MDLNYAENCDDELNERIDIEEIMQQIINLKE